MKQFPIHTQHFNQLNVFAGVTNVLPLDDPTRFVLLAVGEDCSLPADGSLCTRTFQGVSSKFMGFDNTRNQLQSLISPLRQRGYGTFLHLMPWIIHGRILTLMTRLEIRNKTAVGTAVKIEVAVFLFMTPCGSLLGRYQRFGAIRCVRLQGNSSQECMLAQNFGDNPSHCARNRTQYDLYQTWWMVDRASSLIYK